MRRTLVAGLTAALCTATVAALPAAASVGVSAAPASGAASAQAAPGAYGGSAGAELLSVDALGLAGTSVVDLGVGQADAEVDSTGGLPGAPDTVRSRAASANLSPLALLEQLDLSSLLVSGEQTAPPTAPGPVTESLLPLPVNPLLDLSVSNVSDRAIWGVGDAECASLSEPLSSAHVDTAGLELLDLDGLGLGGVVSLLETLLNVDVPGASVLSLGDGLTASDGDVSLVPGSGGRYGVQSGASSSLADVSLLGGLIRLGVVSAPSLTATATGVAGGASVDYQAPVVTVQIAGFDPIVLDPQGQTVLETPDELSGLLDLRIALGDLDQDVAPDGTSASATASLVSVDLSLLGPLADLLDLSVHLDVAPLSASATVPAGGVDCGGGDPTNPLRELNKTASSAEVAPGGTFDYTITVPNRGACTLQDVTIVDRITGPGFEVVGTEPAAAVDGGTVTFDVGSLAPNETATLRIRVRVASDAPDGAAFDDVVSASGLCDGEGVDEQDQLDDVPTVRRDFDGPCDVSFSNKESSHDEVTPGQTFAYFVNAFSAGDEACTDVTVTDQLDPRLDFVSCTLGCTRDGSALRWTLDQVPGGSSATMAVVVRVRTDATGVLANTAVIDPGNGDPTTVTFPGPPIGDQSVPREPVPPSRDGGNGGDGNGSRSTLPKTGASVPLGAASAAAAGAVVLGILRRRSSRPLA